MNWDDPESRLRYIEAHGVEAYNDAFKAHLDKMTVAIVGNYKIRPVASRFGRLFAVAGRDGDTKMAFSTLDQAKMYATMQTKKNTRRAYLAALESFVEAGRALDNAWSELDCKDHDLPTFDYPFKESFDDVVDAIVLWRHTVEKSMTSEGGRQ